MVDLAHRDRTWIPKDHPFKDHLIVLKDHEKYYTFEFGWMTGTWYLYSYDYCFDGTLGSMVRKEEKLVTR